MKYQELVEELSHSIITIQRVQPREPSTEDTNKKERAKLVKMENTSTKKQLAEMEMEETAVSIEKNECVDVSQKEEFEA
ncbi:hypothetical protein L207DRAFT_70394 [Hyaloscypha variabilis F]|uniref:Uncharacterized protein n=1 Tax=Hyaloscypha variabilis (strain UAMH 11265 / GT02V1 / F) TaxID=1149755 RepID=A0A2J6RJ35_HYAVF|nr:hypothetical protein L207DRAFT_70394 [Hyaloscypha variabilis F]